MRFKEKIWILAMFLFLIILNGCSDPEITGSSVQENFIEEPEEISTEEFEEEVLFEEIKEETTIEKKEYKSCFPDVKKVVAEYEFVSPRGYRVVCPKDGCYYTEDKFNQYAREIDLSMKLFIKRTKINLFEFYPKGVDIHILDLESNNPEETCHFPPEGWEYWDNWNYVWVDLEDGVVCLNAYSYVKRGDGAVGKSKAGSLYYGVLRLLLKPLDAPWAFTEVLANNYAQTLAGDYRFCNDYHIPKAYTKSKTLGYFYRGNSMFYFFCDDGGFDSEDISSFIMEIDRKCIREGNSTVDFGDIKCTLDKYIPKMAEKETTEIYKEWLFDESEKEFVEKIHQCF